MKIICALFAFTMVSIIQVGNAEAYAPYTAKEALSIHQSTDSYAETEDMSNCSIELGLGWSTYICLWKDGDRVSYFYRLAFKVKLSAERYKLRAYYDYDETDWLTSVEDDTDIFKTITYTYDNNGNTVFKSDSLLPNLDTTFIYDARNQLVETKRGPPGSEVVLGQYDYNSGGLRVRHRLSERGDVDYYYDQNAVIEEHNASNGSLLAHYRYADRLLSLDTGAATQYYHHDALGSTVNLTDDTGAIQVSYKLDPWGRIKSQTGTSVNRQIFTGQEHDENTGLIYFGARYYDPDTARFLTQDSYLGVQNTPPSLHRYLYAYSNPTVYIDLMGYLSDYWMDFLGLDSDTFNPWDDKGLSADQLAAMIQHEMDIRARNAERVRSAPIYKHHINYKYEGLPADAIADLELAKQGLYVDHAGLFAADNIFITETSSLEGALNPVEEAAIIVVTLGSSVPVTRGMAAMKTAAVSLSRMSIVSFREATKSAIRIAQRKVRDRLVIRGISVDALSVEGRQGSSIILSKPIKSPPNVWKRALLNERGSIGFGDEIILQGDEVFDMALGLATHRKTGKPTLLSNFARNVNAKTYFDIYRSAFPGTMEKLERNILAAMNKARTLKINLDGLIKNIDELPEIIQKGSRGIEPVDVLKGAEKGNITNWEVYEVYTTPKLREKAIFYFEGKQVYIP